MPSWDEQPESTGAGERGHDFALPYIISIIVCLGGIAGVLGVITFFGK